METTRLGNRDLGYRLHKLSLLLERIVGSSLQEAAGLTFAQFKILMSLNHNPAATGSQIADYLGLTEAAVSRQVSQLVDSGFLKRELDRVNRRQHQLTVTARGKTMTDKARLALTQSIEPVYSELTDDHRRLLTEALDGLILRARTVCDMQSRMSTKMGEKEINHAKS